MYKVLINFRDSQDFYHFYKVGDIFPRKGMNVSARRIAELSTTDNKCGKVFIQKIGEVVSEKVEEPTVETPCKKKTYKKSEIMRLNKESLVEVAKTEGLQNIDELSGNKLKELLIKHFNL